MNVYELADALDATGYNFKEVANMLRQQADRIAELEKHLKKVQWALAQQTDILGEMGWHQVNKDGYVKQTPQRNPVAIVRKYTMSGIDNFNVEMLEKLKEGTELYTTPQTNPLSEDEIGEVMSKVDWQYDPESFARAIESKTRGEK